jgi:hypothetical protein
VMLTITLTVAYYQPEHIKQTLIKESQLVPDQCAYCQ